MVSASGAGPEHASRKPVWEVSGSGFILSRVDVFGVVSPGASLSQPTRSPERPASRAASGQQQRQGFSITRGKVRLLTNNVKNES